MQKSKETITGLCCKMKKEEKETKKETQKCEAKKQQQETDKEIEKGRKEEGKKERLIAS